MFVDIPTTTAGTIHAHNDLILMLMRIPSPDTNTDTHRQLCSDKSMRLFLTESPTTEDLLIVHQARPNMKFRATNIICSSARLPVTRVFLVASPSGSFCHAMCTWIIRRAQQRTNLNACHSSGRWPALVEMLLCNPGASRWLMACSSLNS